MNPYRRGIKQVEEEQPPINSTACVAHGCPMPGVYRIKMSGPCPSICRAHDGMPAHEWPRITDAVKAKQRALFTALDLLNSQAGSKPPDDVVAKFVEMGGERYRSMGLTARSYGNSVYLLMLEEIRQEKFGAQ